MEEVYFEYNQIQALTTHTFVDLIMLTTINLQDNIIDRIERRAFMNMNRLKYINLRGNKIRSIADEAFQVNKVYDEFIFSEKILFSEEISFFY